jgi:ATP-dependent DNA ligase
MGRIKSYLGPALQVTPDDIPRYEDGSWGAEEKRDGNWAECQTDASGRIVKLTSRVGKPFGGDAVNGLMGLQTHLPGSTLIGELETGSQAATDRYRALGYRRLHVFDVIDIAGQDLRFQPYEARRRVVEEIVQSSDPDVAKRVPIVRQQYADFAGLWREVEADGGEGLVFKKLGSLYTPVNSDGKVEQWVRCKPYRFVDYVVMAYGKSSLGDVNLQVGLYIKGKLTRVCTIKSPPPKLPAIGSVIECKGGEVFKSGALRHGHMERPRPDKDPQDCTLAAARAV